MEPDEANVNVTVKMSDILTKVKTREDMINVSRERGKRND